MSDYTIIRRNTQNEFISDIPHVPMASAIVKTIDYTFKYINITLDIDHIPIYFSKRDTCDYTKCGMLILDGNQYLLCIHFTI